MRQEVDVGAARHQPLLVGRALAPGQRIGPAFGAFGPLVIGEPHLRRVGLGQAGEPRAQRGLVGIGETSPAVGALPGAVLEAHIQRAARAQRGPQPRQGVGHGGQGHVQQAGATPDAVELRHLVDLLEPARRHVEPAVGAGQPCQLGRRVEGGDLEAGVGKGPGVPAGAAAGIEDVRAGWQLRDEPLADGRHVHADGRVEELGGVLGVVVVGGVHPGGGACGVPLGLPAYQVRPSRGVPAECERLGSRPVTLRERAYPVP
jgi:hypothetical protein